MTENIQTQRQRRLDIALILGLFIAIMIASLVPFGRECAQLQTEVLRLHIPANSDSTEDQRVKLAVRDAVLAGTQQVFVGAENLGEAEKNAQANLELIEQLARAELAKQGVDQEVHVEMANMYFDTRVYESATLPAGRYDAVRITLGEGKGKNWWCVMFPPMCIESAAKEKTPLTEKVENLGKRPDYKIAFASVELVEKLIDKLHE